jgi:Flp pilus assembly protein TadG
MTRKQLFLRDETGQVLVLAAVCLVVLILFLGLAVDVGHLFEAKRRLETAAEAGALAAGLEIRVCSSLANCPTMQTAVQTSLVESGYTGGAFFLNCAASSGDLTLTLNAPPCALGAADPHSGKKGYVEVVLTQRVPTYFVSLIGFKTFPISARSEASRNPGPACIYALDPSAAGALSISIALGINSQCGMVVESSSPAAFSCLVGLGVSAPSIAVHGGAAGLLCLTSQISTGVPVPTPADPLAYLPKPAVGACGTSSGNVFNGSPTAVNIILGGNYIFNPGVYCGGISMTAALLANVTFNPGMYILKSGPGVAGVTSGGLNLTVSLLSNIQGQGVTFYNYGPFGGISITAPAALGLSNFALSAPTSGEYGGVLFMQDPGDTSSGTFVASLLGTSKLEGAIYLPNASMSYGVGAIASAYTILVAKTIQFNVAVLSQFGNNYSALDIGSPLNGDRTTLVQ